MNRKLGLILSGTALCAVAVTGCGTQNQTSSQNSSVQQNSAQGSSTGSASKSITIGYINWSEDVATTYLWKYLLEQKGYQVHLKTVSLGPMFVGLSKGGIDLFFDSWLPEQNQYISKYKSNLATIGKWYKGKTREGFVVPTYMKNVNSISDLNKVKSKLNGRIVGIGSGAVEMKLAKKAVTTYGLKENLISSSAPAMLSALKKAYGQKKDVVVTLWSPHWAFAKYHLKYLSDPKQVFGKPGWIQGETNKKWLNSHPQAAKWLKNFKITQKQLGTLEEDINNSKSKNAAVKKWVSNNQSLVKSWMS
ncbi:glycine betaine ABC transporter substrate-binding protein [Alicyclobacillus sp. SO9]|uniref:glycine betaine ABC transporter substrate-binding protein n=1 Tax=Alicyclobacillus sp. SO9 TaxID=2665646 RepID=UPI0018E776AD|nr:glycine betaine ABC transporter substrate-binding protein [Alicyclobacillus sp. SO9]QQE77226.1 glycine betaine ABC transporter substrate-binding protein [Alicyclobacillus sp. SO9]